MGRVQGVSGGLGIEVGRNEGENLLGESIDRCEACVLQRADGRKGELQPLLEAPKLWGIQGQEW